MIFLAQNYFWHFVDTHQWNDYWAIIARIISPAFSA